jgi:D-alanine-D-alanine ligase
MKIGIFMGGPSMEHSISLKTAENFIELVKRNNYHPVPILVENDCTWTVVSTNQKILPAELAGTIDCALIALHGQYGEDGTIQKILEEHSIPYTGSDSAASVLRADKLKTKQILDTHNIQTPKGTVISNPSEVIDIPFPLFIKPLNGGSSVDSAVIRSREDLQHFWESKTLNYDYMLVEEYLAGEEITCGVIQDWNGKNVYALEPVHIKIPVTSEFFDFNAKYSPETQELCPSGLGPEIIQEIKDISEKVHTIIGARDYSRVDMILHPTRGLFVLELNSLPGFTATSLLPKELAYDNIEPEQFIKHIITEALHRAEL